MPAVGIGADPAVDVGLVGDRPALGRQRQQADAAVGAGDGEAAVGKDDVGFGGFELLGGELAALGDDAERGLMDRRRGQPDRAAGMRAAAHRQAVAVVGDEAHLVGRHAQPFAGELGEAGGMALARRQRADHDLDRAFGQHRDLGALVRRAALRFDIAAEPDAAPQPARRGLGPAPGEAVPVGELQDRVEGADR